MGKGVGKQGVGVKVCGFLIFKQTCGGDLI